ncbi:peptidyl-tRNA hydrolase [Dipodascopsis uninucleata]
MSRHGRNLLVCSIGNPGRQYANTRHSIAHVLMDILLAEHRGQVQPVTSLTKLQGKLFHGISNLNEQLPQHEIGLYKSESYMNVSGVGVHQAWQWHQREHTTSSKLVVIHDDLDTAVGKLKMKSEGSFRGHNGLKSIGSFIPAHGFVRIGIGIGRPSSRDSSLVADYVLSKVPKPELDAIKNDVYYQLRENLSELELTTK